MVVFSSTAGSLVFSLKWGIRKERKSAESFRVNARIDGVDGYSQGVLAVKLRWLSEVWGLPLTYNRKDMEKWKLVVEKKLDEDVGAFKASLLPNWKEEYRKEWTQSNGDIDNERDLFTWMFSKTNFFVSQAAVEAWIDVSLYTGFCLSCFVCFCSDSSRFHLRVQKSIKEKAIGDGDNGCRS